MTVTIQQAIEKIAISYKTATEQYHKAIEKRFNKAASSWRQEMDALEITLTALREKEARENPVPLTIEELRLVNGEPLWLTGFGWRVCYGTSTFRGSEYIELSMDSTIPLDGYGKYLYAYRHKPKEESV